MFMLTLLLVLVILICYLINLQMYVKHLNRLTSGIVEIPGRFPIIGNGLIFLGNNEKIIKTLHMLGNESERFGGLIKFWLGTRLYIGIANPEDAKLVLENCLEKDMVYTFLTAWLREGVFTATLKNWSKLRKILVSCIPNRIIDSYIGTFNEQSEILVQKLNNKSGGESFNVHEFITLCTLDVVFRTSTGENIDIQRNPYTEYVRARTTIIGIISSRFFKVWLQPNILFNLTPNAKIQNDCIKLTNDFTREIINRSKKQSHLERDSKKIKSLLDLLLERDENFSNNELIDQINSMTIAGNDTTASVIAFTLVLLGHYQEYQNKVYREQQDIFGNSLRPVSKKDINNMNFLDLVLKEAMRLYAVAPVIARTNHSIIKMTNGQVIPPETGLVIFINNMHRSAEIWGDDVSSFRPERFLPKESSKRHPASFIPFSFGPRNCIGRNFAYMLMKTIISHVIRSYEIKSNGVGKLKMDLIILPVQGHQVKITKRSLEEGEISTKL